MPAELGQNVGRSYAETFELLKLDLIRAIPKADQKQRDAVAQALKEEVNANKKLEEALYNLQSVREARGLVAHAKLKWIAGAEKNIKLAKEKIEDSQSEADRDVAQKELVRWQQSREKGVEALKERQENLLNIQKYETDYQKSKQLAENALIDVKAAALETVKHLDIRSALSNDKFDVKLAKYRIMLEATPESLEEFAQRGDEERKLIDSMLSSDDLLLQMAVADGAKGGNYGAAMQIYRDIRKASKKAEKGSLQRLALAVALEHAVPIRQTREPQSYGASQTVDPVKRYLHFEKAFLGGELDPAFDKLSTWEYRMVVNGEEPDEFLTWGRKMLQNYRPDHISSDDDRWRYLWLLRHDIPYSKDGREFDKFEFHYFQNILANGGASRRKASFGSFILRAFGIPTVAIQQASGHGSLARWTPQGWVTCLGADWGRGRIVASDEKDLDFLSKTLARADRKSFMQVKRAQWIGDLVGEARIWGLQSGIQPGFWYGVSLYLQEEVVIANKLDTQPKNELSHHQRKIKEEATPMSSQDKKVVIDNDGTITIPAVACSKPTESTRKIKFMTSNLGSMQLHYSLVGKKEDFEYTFNVPVAGRYALSARVVTPSWDQQLQLSVNGSKEKHDIALPYTAGMWGKTQPEVVNLTSGKNVLVFSRDHDRLRGVTIKDFKLTPVN